MTALSWCLVLALSGAVGVAGDCSGCAVRGQLKRFSLDNIKQQILAKLGLEAAPNITGRTLPEIPPLQSIADFQGMQSDQPGGSFRAGTSLLEEADDYAATIEKVYAFAQPRPVALTICYVKATFPFYIATDLFTEPRVRHSRKGVETLYFKFSDVMSRSKVVRAQLWLHLRPSETASSVIVSVRRELPPSSSAQPPYVSVKEMRSRGFGGKWISLDVKKFVSEWFKNPKDNVGLTVHTTVSGSTEHPQRVIDLNTQAGENSKVPFIEVHVTDARKHRTKRTIGLNCEEKMDEKRCCRYPLTVDFEEFGWDWIIAPKKYEANYCSGECPFVFLPRYAHTHIVSMASPAGSPGPCCAPRKMSSISMLYFNQELNIIYGLLPGMVVERCGCS